MADRGTTRIGFVNEKGQKVLRKTDLPGTDHNQYIYVLGCGKCGSEYGANGTDIHHRKCPECGRGEPGLPITRQTVKRQTKSNRA